MKKLLEGVGWLGALITLFGVAAVLGFGWLYNMPGGVESDLDQAVMGFWTVCIGFLLALAGFGTACDQ